MDPLEASQFIVLVACYYPLDAWRALRPNPRSGKRPIVFKAQGASWSRLKLACGRCIGCRLEHSRQWAIRCVHEAQLHGENSFLTLTYDDEHLPRGCPHRGTLVKRDFQKFMKRLREYIRRTTGVRRKVGYYHCGEYGELCRGCHKVKERCKCAQFRAGPGRAHYHAVLFGYDFVDKKFYRKNGRGDPVYVSDVLSKVWGKGFCTIGAVTFESAAYTARYVMKKMSGDVARAHYTVVDENGEMHELAREYVTMSLKPPIAKRWYERFSGDVYPDDFAVIRGRRMKPPRYYDRLHEANHPGDHDEIKERRARYGRAHAVDSTPERLRVRELVHKAQISTLKRELK